MGTITDAAQAIECGDPKTGGEISVGAAAHRGLIQLPSQLLRDEGRFVKEHGDPSVSLQGWTIDSSRHCQLALPIEGLQRTELAVNASRILHARDADINGGAGFGGHYVDAGAPLHESNIKGEASFQVDQF